MIAFPVGAFRYMASQNMQSYRISKMHVSNKKFIEFFSSPEDIEFQAACEAAFKPLGFKSEYDGNYFYITHPDESSEYYHLSIESDQWGVITGNADPWGSIENNLKYIKIFEAILVESGRFTEIN